MDSRTSASSPLRIAELSLPKTPGRLGLTICPGKKGPSAGDYHWDRDLLLDLQQIQQWPAGSVITLLEHFELEQLQIPTLGAEVRKLGMAWFHFEISDGKPPDERFEAGWPSAFPAIRKSLLDGENIVIHCRGGLGRTGTVAALILRELGAGAEEAIRWVRSVRPGAIETMAQETYIMAYQPMK